MLLGEWSGPGIWINFIKFDLINSRGVENFLSPFYLELGIYDLEGIISFQWEYFSMDLYSYSANSIFFSNFSFFLLGVAWANSVSHC